MAHQLEITLKPDLFDAHGHALCEKIRDYFGPDLTSIRTIDVVTLDMALSEEQLITIQQEIFTNPVTQISSFAGLSIPFDWTIWVGYRPGVRDNPGSTAVEAVEDVLNIKLASHEGIHTSRRYCLKGNGLNEETVNMIAGELLANSIIQQWKICPADRWDPAAGIGMIIPKVVLNHIPVTTVLSIESDEALVRISRERNLALNIKDIPVIRSYFLNKEVQTGRALVGLSDPTDIELEYISQARSDHCNHNTFQGLFYYQETAGGPVEKIDNLFKTCIQQPTLALKEEKPWVVSVLWDNAGAGRFDENHYYVITGETHNSPSNMEAYGGAITGIIGVYRDPMGTGKGSKLIMGSYGYCVGHRDYQGVLKPRLHPRRLLDGVIEGVRDGGNKSGVPTPFGQVCFHDRYIGKCLVFVTAVGIMPSLIDNHPAEEKTASPGDLVVMCGGRVGKDGIHGVTASSEIYSENTPAGHVQIGDPYTQKKMHDFLLEARDLGFIRFITDNGGGGLSSSVGESARFSGGCKIDLEKVPLKYEGLDQWEIWVSESQERMTVAVHPDHERAFLDLSKKHAVESTVIGRYTDSGMLHITYDGKTCAYIGLDLLTGGFPQWEFEALWRTPEERGLYEPVISRPHDYNRLILDLLSRPNICSKEWIVRQYDHEVQGTSAVKPLVGKKRDVNSDASVLRPVLDSERGIAFTQALNPMYSAIDAYHMTACVIDEAVRRLIAVGGDVDHIGGVDNFCWPGILYDEKENPDGKFKAAQLVRSCKALKEICRAYRIPLLSGKDSMYVDGRLTGSYGETHKVSGPETLQFSALSVIPDISRCVTMDAKQSGDLVYVIGITRNELGGSEYYQHLGYIGVNIPVVRHASFLPVYRALQQAIEDRLIASAHGIYRGGLAIHLALTAMGGELGMDVDLKELPVDGLLQTDQMLFSESAGRFIVTVPPENRTAFESLFHAGDGACIGRITSSPEVTIKDAASRPLLSATISELKTAWKKPFGDLI